ncbi:hemin ABC transporter substrate-binding protein [Stutzerimonas nosocomialis]|uniref:heme/hemin ABC transporter substrate-binding protein n=1 Tax=Stutzerimonas nosocomialis TaxID=1056496 RepID=UPI0011095266|nr:ABC transporter substrate-binding protein [Stutzerimonas nosocomialis]TLX59114.1 hemin ABC transporter substrate-binding protein [Stutzerimonas nosocomialis]
MRAWLGGVLLGLVCSVAAHGEPLPQRWVSAGGSLTEWIAALGGEARLVGVDTTSQHPASVQTLPSIGYQRQLAAEGILALRPDVLVGSEEMGPPTVLDQLRGAGVQVLTLSAEPELASLADTLERLGRLLGEPARASQSFEEYRQRLARQADWVAAAQTSAEAPGVLLLFGQGGGNLLAGGQGTSADWLIERAGGRNLAGHHGFKPLSSETLAALDPDVLIVTDRSLAGAAMSEALLARHPALASLRAVRESRIYGLDPTLLVGGLGPRLPAELAALAAAFYPHAQALTTDVTR